MLAGGCGGTFGLFVFYGHMLGGGGTATTMAGRKLTQRERDRSPETRDPAVGRVQLE